MNGPTVPSSAYLDRLARSTAERVARAEPIASPYAGANDADVEALTASVHRRRESLLRLSHRLHANPEVAYAEHGAVAAVAGLLRDEGHTVDVGVHGLPTALRATTGPGGYPGGGPHVAVLAEYDALPGIGHGCGHNVICAAAVGAWLALAEHLSAPAGPGGTGGTVTLLGTPAEEGGAGKEHLARAGGLDDVDAVVMLHPFGYDVAAHPFLGRRVVDVVYHGVAAHASAMPFMGRNALDGVVAAYTQVAALRQHILATDRVHGVITDGGDRPNIVPERAAAQFYVRSAEPDTLLDLCARLDAVFEGAATATGTRCEITWDTQPPYLPIRHNDVLAARWATRLRSAGREVLPGGIVPETLTGSTDLGNLSVRMPAIHPMLAIAPPDVALHTQEFAAWAVSERADDGVVDGAAGLAATVADVLADADLRTAMRAEFDAAGGVLDVPGMFA